MTTPSLPDALRACIEQQASGHVWADVCCGMFIRQHGPALEQSLRSLADENRALLREREWRPIESAPKDGTTIDVWVGGEFAGRCVDVQWRKPTGDEWWVHGGDTIPTPDAAWCCSHGPLGIDEPPTHWMPLPAGPNGVNGDLRPTGDSP